MENKIPKVLFSQRESLDIEVMTFAQVFDKISLMKNHDPFAAHKIEFFLILLVTNHSYHHFVDFKSFKLEVGSAVFIAKNQVHYFTQELQQAEGICIIFNSPFMDQFYSLSSNIKLNRLFNYHIESPVVHQHELGEDSLTDIANKLYDEYTFPRDFAKSEILRSLVHILLLKAERAKEGQAISGIKSHWLELFRAFKNMLENEYVTTRNSRDYASNLFISYKFLNDIIKNVTGKTVKAFIDDFVTMEIKRYLVSTSLSIKEISYQTGFEEPANMIKFFRKKTNTTPLKFRQQP